MQKQADEITPKKVNNNKNKKIKINNQNQNINNKTNVAGNYTTT